MCDIPSDIGDCIDWSLCAYTGYFPKLPCILRICQECGTEKFKDSILHKNKAKCSDKRKRFLIKLWETKTVRKEGAVKSFMDWKFERCNYEQLVDLLMKHLGSMAEHNFMASWNYVQYKEARKNITVGNVIFVHDFVQNYLCQHQHEVQGLHWRHQQVTLMPTVTHFKCSKCHQLATHEIVHISDDMKHDAHLVKVFTQKSIQVLKSNNINIHKIIKFTDQAPSQYKNKTAFSHLANMKTPVQKNYFGVRHGKSSCDACTGRVKQGVTRLVKSEQEVVNNAQSFYDACVKHLQISPTNDDKCQHYMITFHFQKQLGKRPKTDSLIGIPETRKLHQIGNTGGNVLNFHKFVCCCFGCLHGTEECQNNVCPTEWTGYDLSTKKTVTANLKFWFGNEFTNCHASDVQNVPQ